MRTIRDPQSALVVGVARCALDSVEDPSSGGERGTREDEKAPIFRRPLTNNVLSSAELESGFYAVLSKLLKWPRVKSKPIKDPRA
jgi:hypothetical protein